MYISSDIIIIMISTTTTSITTTPLDPPPPLPPQPSLSSSSMSIDQEARCLKGIVFNDMRPRSQIKTLKTALHGFLSERVLLEIGIFSSGYHRG